PATRPPTPSLPLHSWTESSRSAGSDGTGTAASYAGRFTRTTTGRRGETGSSRTPAAPRSRSAPPTTTPSGRRPHADPLPAAYPPWSGPLGLGRALRRRPEAEPG